MAFTKGKSGNPGGKTKWEIAMMQRVKKETLASFNEMVRIRNTAEDERLRYQAAKDIWEIGMGKPRQTASVDVTHEIGPAAHTLALTVLANQGAPTSLNPDDSDNTLISLNNSEPQNKLLVNRATIEDAETIEIEPETGENTPKTAQKAAFDISPRENTPPPPVQVRR